MYIISVRPLWAQDTTKKFTSWLNLKFNNNNMKKKSRVKIQIFSKFWGIKTDINENLG